MRVKPDKTAELIVLANLAQYGLEAFIEVSDIINCQCFSDENAYIFKVFEKGLENSKKLDITEFVAILKELGYNKYLSKVNFKELFQLPVNKENLKQFAVKLRKLLVIKELQKELESAHSKLGELTGGEELESIISIAEKPLVETDLSLDLSTNKPELMFCDVDEYLEFLNENRRVPAISTGFPWYDHILGGGLRQGYCALTAGRPRAGKSAWGATIAKNIAVRGIKTLIIDTEMQRHDLMNRYLASEAMIPLKELEQGNIHLSPKYNILLQKGKSLKDIPLYYIRVAGKQFNEILSIIKQWIKSEVGKIDGIYNPYVVIYDYFKLMDKTDLNKMSEYQAVGYQINELSTFMGNNNGACLVLCQGNRQSISQETSDVISQSDRLVWLCYSVTLLRNKSHDEILEEGVENGNRKLIPLTDSRFSEGLPMGTWINCNFHNFQFTEVGLGGRAT